MENNLKTIVYMTINTINNKIYIGVHDTNNPFKFDGYYGCGISKSNQSSLKHPKTPLARAIKKYGFKAFTRVTLFVYDSREEALKKELELVNDDFLARPDVYNICLGGGNSPVYKREVFQFSLKGDFIQKFESIEETGFNGIAEAIKYRHTSNGFYWTDFFVKRIDITQYHPQQIKTLYVYNLDGTFKESFESISKFCKDYDVTLGVVQRAIKSKNKVKDVYVAFEQYEMFLKERYKKHYGDPIHQYSLDGTYLKTFNSVKEVVNTLGLTYRGIPNSIQNQTTCGNYQWSWDRIEKMPNKVMTLPTKKKIGQYDANGNLVKIWDSVRDCRSEFANVSKVLKGYANQCKGYYFKYLS